MDPLARSCQVSTPVAVATGVAKRQKAVMSCTAKTILINRAFCKTNMGPPSITKYIPRGEIESDRFRQHGTRSSPSVDKPSTASGNSIQYFSVFAPQLSDSHRRSAPDFPEILDLLAEQRVNSGSWHPFQG